MFNVRKETFETNSSSTHTIVIAKEDDSMSIPDEIDINLEDYEFGWEYDKYWGTDEKLAYLIFGLVTETYYKEGYTGYERIMQLLETIGQWVKTIHIRGIYLDCYNGKAYLEVEDGYVDHASDMDELLDAVLNNEELLKRYLFSTKSFIATGNDNSDGYPIIYVDYDYDDFYKGN